MSDHFDHLIIGAGHNGLACAIELSRRGRRVLVVEASDQVGGLATTRTLAPGYHVGAGAHLLYGLPANLVREWQLEQHGLRFAARSLPTCALRTDGPALVIEGSRVHGVSDAEASAWSALHARLSRHAQFLRHVNATAPFSPSLASWAERLDAIGLALRLRLTGRRAMRDLLRIGGMNVYDLLTETLTSAALQGAVALDATLGAEYAARSPGTVLTLLHRMTGELDAGDIGLAIPAGGPGALSHALASAARAAGAIIRTASRVDRILIEGDRACGVRLADGEILKAGSVISNADPRTTFLRLVGAADLDTDFVRRVDHFRARGLVAKLHLALDGLPAFSGLEARHQGARLVISPDLDYLERAFNPSKYRELPDEPVLEILIPSIHDPTLAPPGGHVLSAQVMFVPYDLGADPQAARERLRECTLSVLERHAPGLRARIVAEEFLAPVDLEREFGVSGGHWHHGALGFDQYFFNRPVAGAARYATPLPGLFLCGAGTHPGGGLTCRPGRNAARAVLRGGH